MPGRKMDLHMHSYYSDDGEMSPEHLVKKCRECGVEIMAITDHNCVRANYEAEIAAQMAGIIYIPGIEIDCTYQDVNLHLLGYGITYQSSDFEAIETNIKKQARLASYQTLLATRKLGFHVTEEEMIARTKDRYWNNNWAGELFAEVLLQKQEYKEHPLLLPYRPDGVRGDSPYVNFYWDYYSQGKPCYVKIDFPKLEEMIKIIHENGGCAVLAHPGANFKNRDDLLREVLQTGVDGIEAYSSYHTEEQANYYAKEAFSMQLLVTSGSDYHGKMKPAIKIGDHKSNLLDIEIDSVLRALQ